MSKKILGRAPALLALAALILSSASPVLAGSSFEWVDITGFSSTFPPLLDGKLIPSK